jgi:hypothetical protein
LARNRIPPRLADSVLKGFPDEVVATQVNDREDEQERHGKNQGELNQSLSPSV